MNIIARHPISESALVPHIGKPVCAYTIHGDLVYGVLKSCGDGKIVLVPPSEFPPAGVSNSIRKALKQQQIKPRSKARSRNGKGQKASVKGFYPYGYGGFGYGYGFGAGIVLPLFLLAAIAASPFFFW